MSIEELLFDIAMSDGSPEAYHIIKDVPKEHWNEVVKLWEDGVGDDLPNADSCTRLRYIADSINNDIESNTVSGMSEQERDLREVMGTDKEMGIDAVDIKDDSVPEQIEGLAELLKGVM